MAVSHFQKTVMGITSAVFSKYVMALSYTNDTFFAYVQNILFA